MHRKTASGQARERFTLYRSSIDFIGESPIEMSDTDEREAVWIIYFKVYIKYSIFQNKYK